MIKANHQKPAEWIFRKYILNLLKRHFSTFFTLNQPDSLDPDLPLILLPNHSTWWDGFFFYLINHHFFQRKIYLMMLEEQLKKNPFFKYVGAYSINPGTLSGVKESINYTLDLLNEQHKIPKIFCIFPQGELLPWTSPVSYQKGIAFILKRIENPVQVCPLNMHAFFRASQYPDVLIKFGQIYTVLPGKNLQTDQLEEASLQLKSDIEDAILNHVKGSCFFQGRISINERFGQKK